MLDTEFTIPPPSPSQVLKVVCEIFGPAPDPDNPFNDRQHTARRKLATDMLVDVYGKEHPISQIILSFDNYMTYPMADGDRLTDWKDRIDLAAQQIHSDLEQAIEYVLCPEKDHE